MPKNLFTYDPVNKEFKPRPGTDPKPIPPAPYPKLNAEEAKEFERPKVKGLKAGSSRERQRVILMGVIVLLGLILGLLVVLFAISRHSSELRGTTSSGGKTEFPAFDSIIPDDEP